SNADYIVTGDEDLLVLEKYNDIKIVSPNKYLESVTMQSSVTAVVYLLVHSLEWGFGSGGIKQKELIKQKK
ncbi:MAG: hypothetical protein LBU83_03695, partial [Bacteroidales bacterium]|nr:hypothetical protein [Bacteroidales bacterium]